MKTHFGDIGALVDGIHYVSTKTLQILRCTALEMHDRGGRTPILGA